MAELMPSEAHTLARRLLPPNAAPRELALLAAELTVLSEYSPERIRATWDPATIAPELLPYLAWALSVDVWSDDWPEATKRAVIAAAPAVHRRKGTLRAVVDALVAFGADFDLVEWWQDAGGAIPRGHFRANLNVRDHDAVPGDQFRTYVEAIRAAIRAAKPKSRPMELGARNVQRGDLKVGMAARLGGVVRTRRFRSTDQTATARSRLGAVSRTGGVRHTTGLFPDLALRTLRLGGSFLSLDSSFLSLDSSSFLSLDSNPLYLDSNRLYLGDGT